MTSCWTSPARNGTTTYHLIGTAKMGPATDPGAVVDDQLARPRPAGAARGRRLDHAVHAVGQHLCDDADDRRAGGRLHPARRTRGGDGMMRLNRRSAMGLPAPGCLAPCGRARAETVTLPFGNGERPLVQYPEKRPLLRLTSRPPQLETPFSVFNESLITPNDAFYVRYHLAEHPAGDRPGRVPPRRHRRGRDAAAARIGRAEAHEPGRSWWRSASAPAMAAASSSRASPAARPATG